MLAGDWIGIRAPGIWTRPSTAGHRHPKCRLYSLQQSAALLVKSLSAHWINSKTKSQPQRPFVVFLQSDWCPYSSLVTQYFLLYSLPGRLPRRWAYQQMHCPNPPTLCLQLHYDHKACKKGTARAPCHNVLMDYNMGYYNILKFSNNPLNTFIKVF